MIISKRAPPKSQNKMEQEVGQEKYEIVCGALKKGCDYEKTSELALSSKKGRLVIRQNGCKFLATSRATNQGLTDDWISYGFLFGIRIG